MNYKDKNVGIIGYGMEGKSVEKFLKSKGAKVEILDQKISSDYLSNLERFDILVRSAGVYPFKPEIVKAVKMGVRLTSPTHIFFDEFAGFVIGVTGTKGKGTTSTLIYEILKSAGQDVYLAGNIGLASLDILPKLKQSSVVVLEMSSFQLIDLPVSPNISVVLNITKDHLDWHKDLKEYTNSKINIVKHQSASDWAVINSEYKSSLSFAKHTKANIIYFNKKDLDPIYRQNLIIKGQHNLENIAAAVAVAKIMQVKKDIIIKTVSKFKGLEHRLEFVRNFNGTSYYNDSFATGPDATIAAIKSFDQTKTLILGGSDKGLNYDQMIKAVNLDPNIKNIILIGQVGKMLKSKLNSKKINVLDMGRSSMKEIVEKASTLTSKGSVVLLSPAAASFDMFKDYKDRGSQFKTAVKTLKI